MTKGLISPNFARDLGLEVWLTMASASSSTVSAQLHSAVDDTGELQKIIILLVRSKGILAASYIKLGQVETDETENWNGTLKAESWNGKRKRKAES